MRGGPHYVVGAAIAMPLAFLGGPGMILPLVIVGGIAALMPDIDHPYSLLGRFIPWPGISSNKYKTGRLWFTSVIWHRDQFHSFFMGGLIALLFISSILTMNLTLDSWGFYIFHLSLMDYISLYVAFMLGYFSHLLLDTINPSPQMLYWPFSNRRIRPTLIPALSSRSMGFYALEIAVSCFAILLLSQTYSHFR